MLSDGMKILKEQKFVLFITMSSSSEIITGSQLKCVK